MSDASGIAGSSAAESRKGFLVVGLGGSAGAIPAFREFFRNVPPDSGMAYVVILHLSPEHESRLAEVLQGSSVIPVKQVRERVEVEPDQVYVIPPNQSLTMQDGSLVLSPIAGVEQRRAPVDIFFRTLGEACESRAVCVILSGSGSDGSVGLRRVKEFNGLVIAQDPDEAQFGEMPRNSVATGLVDVVLPVARMPGRIIAYREKILESSLRDLEGEEYDEQTLVDVFTNLRLRTGQDFSNYKRATVLRRIERRMALHEVTRLSEYARLLRDRPDEPELLLRELLISVTDFFRDAKVWETVERDVIPKLLERKGEDDHVRVWVAGCATGEEAYTVAMLLAEAASRAASPPEIQIFATDLDENAIVRARNGLYTEADVADIPPERVQRHFTREHDHYRVRRELRELMLFAHHNLLKDPPFSHIDFVSCRNLLIYLNRAAQERTMEVLHFALDPGGWLLLGTAESADSSSQLFALSDREAHIYSSRPVPRVLGVPAPGRPLTVASALNRTSAPPLEREERRSRRFAPLDLHHRLVEEYAPPSLVVDEKHDIVHLSGRAGRYLQFAAGEASLNVLQVIRPELRIPLRTALFQAAQTRGTVVQRGLEVNMGERSRTIDLTVRPALDEDEAPAGYFLVLFEESRRDAPASEEVAVRPAEPAARHLEEELIRAKAQMRATVEQYEMQVEEAKASNEELQAMNEELRSTAEELETSQEELQSLNEELQTVNQELNIKIEEIGRANDDLRNLMSSTEIGTIFVDRSLRVKLFTPRVRDLFHLIPADVGRPLLDINSRLSGSTLAADLDAVLDRLLTIEREVDSEDGRWYLMRLLPYRTAEDRIDGVVLTFLEMTAQHRAQESLRETQQRQAFLLKLSDALRLLGDPAHIQQTAIRVLAEELDLARAVWFEIKGDDYSILADHSRGVPPLAGRYPIASFGHELLERHRVGRLTVVNDVAAAHSAGEQQALAAMQVGAYVAVPLSKEGRFAGGLSAHSRSPREWTALELALVEETAERTWAAVESAHAEKALRKSEEKFRTLFDSIDDGFAMVDLIRDPSGRAIDFVYAETNPAFVRHLGVDLKGARRPEVLAEQRDLLLDSYERVLRTGTPLQLEYMIHSLAGRQDQWFQITASRVGRQGADRLGVVFRNVTDRKRREANLQFLAGLADDFSRLASAEEIMETVCGKLGAFLNVRSCQFVAVDEVRAEARALYAWDLAGFTGEGTPALPPDPRSAAPAGARQTVVTDGAADESRGAGDAVIAVPFRRGRERRCQFVVRGSGPREWRRDEIDLVEEVASRLFPRLERATAEEALRQSEERHRIIVEGARDYAILTTDLDGRITSWSPGAAAIFGWSAAEAVGQPVDVTFVEEERASGVPDHERKTARERGSAPDVRWHVRKDGSRVFIEGIVRPLFDAAGALAGFLKIGQDVTERTRTEAALRESERRLQTVTNLVPDLLWSTDAEGAVDWVNQRWLAFTGQTLDQARGEGWFETVHPGDREASRARFRAAIRSGEPLRLEHRMRDAAGRERWFLVQAEPLRDGTERIARWFGAATDIHEQRIARDELEQRVKERTRELAELSVQRQQLLERLVAATEQERQRIARELHDEMGQHLTALRLGLQALRPQGEGADRMKSLIDRLDQSVDRLTFELRPTSLDQLGLHGAITSLAEEINATTGLRVDLHLPGVEGERFSDVIETAMYRLVQEALTNVLKHSGAKLASVIVERDGNALRLIVEDDGSGFEDDETVEGVPSRGRFGLLGIRERLALLGGSLHIESQPGSGTTIYVRVPLTEVAER